MVCPHVDTMLLGFHVVAHEVAVADGGAFRRFDVDKRHGEGLSAGIVTCTQRGDAQLAPVDGEALAPLLMLVA